MTTVGHPKQTRICLLTGYLGAGKTTLLNHILKNDRGIRAAVLVNDIGEINVDESLIAQGGFAQMDGELIPLTNGCICCSLSDDLALQLEKIAASGDFDYIIIEASGVCEPIPIAYTISNFCDRTKYDGAAPLDLDNIVAVVDCARMWDEFNGGSDLLREDLDDTDIESLLVQQIEFCSTLVLNKVDCVSAEQLAELKAIVRGLQKKAVIVEATQGNVDLDQLLNTGRFDFDTVYGSATWLDAMEHGEDHEDEDAHEHHDHDHEHGEHDHHDHDHAEDHGHEHHHHDHDDEHEAHHHEHDHDHDGHDEHGHHHHGHHHHHHEDGHGHLEEFGIETFVYRRRQPFDLAALNGFAATWPREIIRAKGQVWCDADFDMACVFEQAGRQFTLTEQGRFLASAPEKVRHAYLVENPQIAEDWDPVTGDRQTKICFIGRHMDKEKLIAGLDACLTEWEH